VLAYVLWSTDQTLLAEIEVLRRNFQTTKLPIMEKLSGTNGAAYLNEADVNEPDLQTTFFGPKYSKLTRIEAKYDPDLFTVAAGVGSERWDQWGLPIEVITAFTTKFWLCTGC
jgi:hypothetical protein